MNFLKKYIFVLSVIFSLVFAVSTEALVNKRTALGVSGNIFPTPTVFLPIVFDKQDRSLSCEVAALKMALAYHGVRVQESTLLKKVGFDTTAKKVVNGQKIWGDPNKGFVGDIDGKMPATGYGVYSDPITRAGKLYRPTYSIASWDLRSLSYELDQGNPIIAWIYIGKGTADSWKTPEGKRIQAVYNEHTVVVNGYTGSSEAPTGFHVIDTLYGPQYYSAADFLKRWRTLGRTGVVVN